MSKPPPNLLQLGITGTKLQNILENIYQNYIAYEIACFRQELEHVHFVYGTYMLGTLFDQLQNSLPQEGRHVVDTQIVTNANEELKNFITFFLKYRLLYINQHYVNELNELERNRSDQEYLSQLGTSYKYESMQVSQKVFEKIECIKQELLRVSPQYFELFFEKNKLSLQKFIRPSDCRYGIMTGTFQAASRHVTRKEPQNTNDQTLKITEGALINRGYTDYQHVADTMMQEDYLRVFAQIEKVQKDVPQGQMELDDLFSTQLSDVYKSKTQYLSTAEQIKQYLIKYISRREEELQAEQENRQQDQPDRQKQNYWNQVEYKIQHDRIMIESLMNDAYSLQKHSRPTLINLSISENTNQACMTDLGKFGNILAVGLFDGQIIIYELTERFLVPGIEPKIEHQKHKMLVHNSFIMQGHCGPITTLNLMYDELYLLSAGVDRIIKLWCLRQRSPLIMFKGHMQTIWSIAWAPAGYLFASGSADSTAMIWATDHIHCQKVLRHSAGVNVVAFTPSVQQLLTGDENRAFRIWNIEKAECLYLIGLDSPPTCFAISLSGQFLAIGGNDGKIQLYFLPTMKEIKTIILNTNQQRTTKNQIHSLSFSYDECCLVACDTERVVFYNTGDFLRQNNEDGFLGVYTSQQLRQLNINEANLKSAVKPILMLDGQGNQVNWSVKYLPQGVAVQLVK